MKHHPNFKPLLFRKQSSIFISKKPRLAATMAMLGTEIQSSIVENPGPGAYQDNMSEWTKTNKLEQIQEIFKEQNIKKKERINQAIMDIEGDQKKKKIKPSIPNRKPPKNGFSGVDQDTPGPSGYQPKSDFVKNKAQSALFSKSKVDREIFQINENIPGPSDYDKKIERLSKKDFSKNNTSAIFGSKVPNCKDKKIVNADLPGPGQYDPFKDNHILDKNGLQDFSKLQESMQIKSSNYLQNAINQPSITRKIECPFVDVHEREQIPGPGNYFYTDAKEKILQRLKTQQYDAIVKAKPAFNSQLQRDCNKSLDRVQNIGPGVYIDINNPINSSFNKTLLKFQSDKSLQQAYGIEVKPFGSSTERFKVSSLIEQKQLNEFGNFGLASQQSLKLVDQFKTKKQQQTMKYDQIRESKSQGSYQFKSKAKRINFQDQNDLNVITLNSDMETNQKSQFNCFKQYKDHNNKNLLIQCATNDRTNIGYVKPNSLTQRVNLQKSVYFESSTERFGFNQIAKQTLEQIPGPGSYEINTALTTRPASKNYTSRNKSKTGFCSTEKKFNPKFNSYISKQSSEQIGPGFYHKPKNQSMVKKSYNMAIEGASFV